NEVLATEPELAEGSRDAANTQGYLEFRNVSFSYPGADEPVLTDISFSAAPGQTIGIIGSTGSGKTTLLNLIPRLTDTSADRKSTRLNSSHVSISYAVFCLKKKKK